ncbi:hypothetical protein NM208_g4063 [Fusarium decemcellulare]|uniref:Uncharacterized protein n=1 Tax=Fusarium decemcellulare TaxID=57161 RepID=A0ACC1SM38_9HYPO|nr:hypothetical protein NM208_g4063 [Fusarium decemcellulare]
MSSISFREFIRWLPDEASEPTSTIVLTSPEHRFVDIQKLPLDRLDWAIAGTSSSEPTGEENVTRGQWHHWISSRTIETEGLCDEGYNHLQPDGKTLERGAMVNPETGKETDYEELWRDEDPLPTTFETPKTIVLRLERGDEVKGLVILLGQYCQGLLRKGGNITAERWYWTKSDGWVRTIAVGEDALPHPQILDTSILEVGEILSVGDEQWRVIESGGK